MNKKAFSLVELLVAMAIIAVLISIAAFGINITQRNARDTKRRKVVQDLVVLISDIQANTLNYPDGAKLDRAGKEIIFTQNGAEVGRYPVKAMDVSNSWFRVRNTGNACARDSGFYRNAPLNDNLAICIDFKALEVGVRLEAASRGGEGFVLGV